MWRAGAGLVADDLAPLIAAQPTHNFTLGEALFLLSIAASLL